MNFIDLILNLQNQESMLARFDAELYVNDKTSAELRAELPYRSSETSNLVGEIIRKHSLEFLVFKAVTDYEAQEEVTVGSKDKLGYSSYILARLLSGRKMMDGQIRRYFLDLAKNNKMQVLTEASRSYVENFNVEYVLQTSADSLKERIPIFSKPVKRPENYAPFLRELHKKVREDKVLQYEMLKKWAGIEREDQITYAGTKDIPGYDQLKSLCAFFTGRVMTEKETGRYFKWLVRTKGGTVKTKNLTDIIMGFGDNIECSYAAKLVSEYISSMTPEEVRKELSLNLTKEKQELSQKIRELRLEFIIFKAATGYEAVEDINKSGTAYKKGYSSFTALAHLLSGMKKNIPETGEYFRCLAKKYGMPGCNL